MGNNCEELSVRIKKIDFLNAYEIDGLIDKILKSDGNDEEISTNILILFQKIKSLIIDQKYDENEGLSLVMGQIRSFCFGEVDYEKEFSLYRYRELYRDIIYSLPSSLRQKYISKLIDNFLSKGVDKNGLWTISKVGFNDERLSYKLKDIFLEDSTELGDIAFSVYIGLGNTQNVNELLGILHSKIDEKYSLRLISSAARIGNLETAKIIINKWIKSGKINYDSRDFLVVLSGIVSICHKNWRNESELDCIWNDVWNLDGEFGFHRSIALSHFPRKTNSIYVIPQLLENTILPRIELICENAGAGLAPMTAIFESVLPSHIKSWGKIKENCSFDLLMPLLKRNSGEKGFYSTIEGDIKKKTLQLYLNAGNLSFIDHIHEILENEDSKFIQAEILKELSCFELDHPDIVIDWVLQEQDLSGSDGRPIAQFEAALRFLAYSKPTLETLKVLMGFGLTYKGNVLRSTVDIIYSLCMRLARSKASDLLEYIFTELFSTRNPNHQFILSSIILDLSYEYPSIVKRYEGRIILGITLDGLCVASRGDLLETLGIIKSLPKSDLLEKIYFWALKEDEKLSDAAVFYLLSVGQISNDLLTMRLGLQKNQNGGWEPSTEFDRRKVEYWGTWMGMLYAYDQKTFANSVAQVLNSSRWNESYQLLKIITETTPYNKPPDAILDALKKRIETFATTSHFESSTIDAFYVLAPNEFAEYDWAQQVINWISDGREFLAKKLGKISIERFEAFKRSILGCLQALINDDQYAVRRSAFRSLSLLSQDWLISLCSLYADDSSYENRQIAAEGYVWIRDKTKRNKLFEKLSQDNERDVRESTQFSLEQARPRVWASQYIGELLNAEYLGNEHILDMWCYANALIKVGDDVAIEKLVEFLEKKAKSFSLNAIWFFQKTIKSMRKEWKRKTQKWPDPWFIVQGDIERCEGLAEVGSKEEKIITHIWKRRRTRSHEVSSWGGIIEFLDTPFFVSKNQIKIILDDGRQGIALPSASHNNMVYFLGSGPFPKKD